MSDATGSGAPPRSTASGPADTARQVAGEARAAAAGIGAEARQAAGTVREEAARALDEVKAEGGAVVEAAQSRAVGFAEEQKQAGAAQAEGLARAVHRAADELQETSPQLARTVHEAADAAEGFARALRDRSPGDLMGEIEGLARRQPAAFFGAAVLAGFALARFAKSSAEQRSHVGMGNSPVAARPSGTSGGMTSPGTQGIATPKTSAMGAPGWVPDPANPQGTTARPATMAAASLGGAAAMPKPADRTGPLDPAI